MKLDENFVLLKAKSTCSRTVFFFNKCRLLSNKDCWKFLFLISSSFCCWWLNWDHLCYRNLFYTTPKILNKISLCKNTQLFNFDTSLGALDFFFTKVWLNTKCLIFCLYSQNQIQGIFYGILRQETLKPSPRCLETNSNNFCFFCKLYEDSSS